MVCGVKYSMHKHLQSPQISETRVYIYSASSWETVTGEHLEEYRPANLHFQQSTMRDPAWSKMESKDQHLRLSSDLHTQAKTFSHLNLHMRTHAHNFIKVSTFIVYPLKGKGSALTIWTIDKGKG